MGHFATQRMGRAEKKEQQKPNLLRREEGKNVKKVSGREKSGKKSVWEEINTLDI